jgi:hypothetical protein
MRIAIATPLYPPDIAEPAPYVKELAKRLSGRHTVTVIAYARLPEKVPGVEIIAIDKRKPLPLRLIAFFFALLKTAKKSDVLYTQNGPSVELPAWLVASLTRTPLVVHIGDTAAHEYAAGHPLRRTIESAALARARSVINSSPLVRPEVLPFVTPPVEQLAAYEESWNKHLEILENAFNHVK